MIRIDLDKMVAISKDLYTSAARDAFGDEGQVALQLLLSSIVHIYRRLDPGLRTQPLVLFAEVSSSTTLLPSARHTVHSIENLTHELDGACLVRVRVDSSLEISALEGKAIAALSEIAVVYEYDSTGEKFIIRGRQYRLTNPVIGYASVYCKPTFSSLSTALDTYRLKAAAYSSCDILNAAWNETSRWFFKQKPEQIMRRSLVQYLRSVLNDAEVRPEQNVDESHPVDVHVSFSLTDQRAIIEIKWMGQSVDDVGRKTTGYTQTRAEAGAKQLAEYLDSSNTWGPGVKTRGYLVVFDARRKGLKQGMTSLPPGHALHYKDKDIKYKTDYSVLRSDFHAPVRMYMYPQTT
jgi:hypothetical protein